MKFKIQNPAFLQMAGNKVNYFYIRSLVNGNELKFNEDCILGQFAENLQYSVNSIQDWEQLTEQTVLSLDEGEVVYFRNYTGATYSPSGSKLLFVSEKYDAGGDIARMLYPNTAEMPAHGLADSFSESNIVSAAGLILHHKYLGEGCYSSMFAECKELVSAPKLPATVLAKYCYSSMFGGCKELVSAPKLPATVLAEYCYDGMFGGCTKLKSIVCLATQLAADSTVDWVDELPSSGTFTKSADMEDWPTGTNGIPAGWTVQDYVG